MIPVTMNPMVAFGSPSTVPARVTGDRRGVEARAFDILPDGRLVGLTASDDSVSGGADSAHIRVVLNWFQELKALTSAK